MPVYSFTAQPNSVSDFSIPVSEFMRDFGATAYITQYTQGVYDPATSKATVTSIDIPCTAIQMQLDKLYAGQSSKSGTLIAAADFVAYVAPIEGLTKDIAANRDRFKMNGISYDIVTVKKHATTGLNVAFYELYVKQ